MLQQFTGHIVGVGTASGTRVVVGRWDESPLGRFTDAMVEDASGHRTLLAPSQEVADFVAATYTFDEVRVVPVTVDDWHVTLGPLDLVVRRGRRAPVGLLLPLVPWVVGRTAWWARLCDPVARRVMPGVRTLGSAGGGRLEWYAARDAWLVDDVRATWDGRDLGALAPVAPPVRFGFGSAPRRPMLTRLSSFVRLP